MKYTLNFFKNVKRWVKLDRHPLLYPMVNFIIKMGWFSNHGKFKPLEKVKYNLFAKVVIASVVRDRNEINDGIYTVDDYEPWSKDKSNIRFLEDSGCDVFWIRRLYPWERRAFLKKFFAQHDL
jgi:hypothetical protein